MEFELNAQTIKMIAKEIDLSIGNFVALVGLKAWTSLVFKTPVGNPSLWKSKPPKGYVGGQAKFSWNMQYSRIDKSTPTTWGGGVPSTPNIKAREDYKTLYVTSSLPYMERLENGWSSQGSHMIKRTVGEIGLKLKQL